MYRREKGALVENCERLCYIQKKIGPVDALIRYSTRYVHNREQLITKKYKTGDCRQKWCL